MLHSDHEAGAVGQHKNTIGYTHPGDGDGSDYGLEATGARTLAGSLHRLSSICDSFVETPRNRKLVSSGGRGAAGSMVMGSKLRFAFVIAAVAWHSSDAFVPLSGSLHDYHDVPCATRYPGRSLQGHQMKEHQRNTYTQALPTTNALRNTDRGSGSKFELFRGKILAGAAVLAVSFGAPQPSLAGQVKDAAGVFV